MNLADIIISLVLLTAVISAIIYIIVRKRKGKMCSCGCENCAYKCEKNKNK